MRDKLEPLNTWNDLESTEVWDGYNTKSMPKATPENFETLLRSHNNLIDVVALLCRRLNVDPFWDI